MNAALLKGGRLIGLLGLIVMTIAVASRLAGYFLLGGFSTGTLMLGGMGAVCAGCFLLLCTLADRSAPGN